MSAYRPGPPGTHRLPARRWSPDPAAAGPACRRARPAARPGHGWTPSRINRSSASLSSPSGFNESSWAAAASAAMTRCRELHQPSTSSRSSGEQRPDCHAAPHAPRALPMPAVSVGYSNTWSVITAFTSRLRLGAILLPVPPARRGKHRDPAPGPNVVPVNSNGSDRYGRDVLSGPREEHPAGRSRGRCRA